MSNRLPSALLRALIVVAIPVLAGCISTGRPPSIQTQYGLDLLRNAPRETAVPGSVLKTRYFTISPRFKKSTFLYKVSPVTYSGDYYSEFLVSPNALIAEQVHLWLANSGLFEHVVDANSYMNETHYLEGDILALYGDFSKKEQPIAVLELGLLMLKRQGNALEPLIQKRYLKNIPLVRPSAPALVEGWKEALSQILAEFEADLQRTQL
ncbi:MAG: hypothetical protein JW937_03690 [Candidatus Omnitrophica bacterium]|nr:hypothetical protein [Candidatus Omnitrophota bacterium]